MAKLPDATSLISRGAPRSERGGVVSFNSNAGQGLIQAGKAMGEIGAELQVEADRRQAEKDKFEAAKASLMLDEYIINKHDDFQRRPQDYVNFEKEFDEGFSSVFEQASAQITSPRQQEFFGIAAKEKRLRGTSQVRDLGLAYQRNSESAYIDRQSEVSARDLMMNPTDTNYRAKVMTHDAYIDGTALLPSQKEEQKQKVRKSLTATALEGLTPKETIERTQKMTDPVSVIMRNELPADGVVRVHKDGNGMAIGGIHYNPNSKEHQAFEKEFFEAKQILETQGQDAAKQYIRTFYDEKIIKANGIDKLPADVQDVVADGVTNHWGEFQGKLIEAAQSGATRDQLLDMRQAEYDRLTSSPRAAENKWDVAKKGWDTRIKNLRRPDYDTSVVMAARERAYAAAPQIINEQVTNAEAMAVRGEAFEPIDKRLLEIAEAKKPGITAESELRLRKATATHEMLGLSEAERAERLKQFEPDKANAAGYAEQSKAYEELRAASDSAKEKQEKATAESAIASNPSIAISANIAAESNLMAAQAAATAADTGQPFDQSLQQKASADMQAYLGEIKQYADKVGVRNPTLLTDSAADGYADMLTAQYKNREARFAALSQIKSATGEYFTDVVQQIASKIFTKSGGEASAKAKNGSNSLLMASKFLDINTPESRALAATVINNFDVDDKELFDGIESGSNYATKEGGFSAEKIRNSDTYKSQMEDYNATIVAADPAAYALLSSFNDQIIRAGAIYAKSGGLGIDEGMKLAISQARSGYVFATQGGKDYLGGAAPPIAIPMNYADKATQIQSFADRSVDYIALSRELKIDYAQGDGMPRDSEDVAASVRDNAYWASDKNGLKLVMPTAAGNVAVLDAKTNKPIVRGWDDFTIGKRSLEQVKKIEIPSIRANLALDLAMSFPPGGVPQEVTDALHQARKDEAEFNKTQRSQVIKEQVFRRKLYDEKGGK